MYRGRLWTLRQYSGFGSAAATNERFQFLLKGGQTGLSVAFDLPTQNGYDSDHQRAHGEVGRCGVPVTSLGDMRTLFRGIPLDRATVSMTINATAPILTFVAGRGRRGERRAPGPLGGTVQNDILKEYIARGTYIYPPGPSMRLTVDLIEFTTREMPQWNYISVSGYHMREAGATAVQEVAFTLANAIAYVRAARDRGLDLDEFLPRLSFFFSADRNFLEEVAKFRAARRLWARSARRRVRGEGEPLEAAPISHADGRAPASRPSSPSSTSCARPWRRSPRSSAEPSPCTRTRSTRRSACRRSRRPGSRCGPSRSSLRSPGSRARSTRSAAPTRSSTLTDRIETEAREYLDRIEPIGGALVAIERGFVSERDREGGLPRARARERKEEVVVGVNEFTEGNPRFSLFAGGGAAGVHTQRITPAEERQQVARLRRWRQERDRAALEAALAELRVGPMAAPT